MRFSRSPLLGFLFLLVSVPLTGQQATTSVTQAPQRDPQALALLQQAIRAMATIIPADSSATGAITIVEGSTTQTGTIQILTRGTNQTSEQITLTDTERVVVYSNGDAKEVNGSQSAIPPLELIVTDQSPDFPLPLLLSVLNNPDEAYKYIGQESLNGTTVHHIQAWNTFASHPRLQKLAPFSARDIWFDSSSGLPAKLSYSRRAGGGAVPSFPVEVFFSNYNNVSGILYPFQVKKSYNGTPWETISIHSVFFNTGLTDAQFRVE